MSTREPVRVAIIGCGLIGTDWDRTVSADMLPLTHAGAFAQHPRAQVVALCDRDAERVRNAANYLEIPHAYTDLRQLFAEHNINVAVIATSSDARWTVIEPALTAGVKLLVIEKPLASSLEEAHHLVAAMDAAGARSVVNYSRNWDPSIRELRDRIAAGEMGRIQRIVAYYGKGISNNASHAIDLVGLLCDAWPLRARALGSPLNASEADWSVTGDRAWDAQIEFMDAKGDNVNLMLLGTDQRAFTCFELRIFGCKAMFELSLGGRVLKWSELQNDPHFPGHIVPAPSNNLRARYLESMQKMADEVVRLATGDATTASCDAHTALRSSLTIEAIHQSVKNDGLWVELDSLSSERR